MLIIYTLLIRDVFSESIKSDATSYSRVILGSYATSVNDYINRILKYKTDLPYEILNFEVYKAWDMPKNKFLDMSASQRKAMTDNHHLKVWISSGYYDLATPYFATEYTINHLFLEPTLKKNISTTYYEAGHMFYIDLKALKQFKHDFNNFIKSATPE